MSTCKRKHNKGKSKGSAFEREMCKRLSKWWTGGASSQVFWRNSGFLARGPGCQAHQYGDVHAIDERGEGLASRVNVELKFYRDLRVLDVIDKPGKGHVTLIDHWRQCLGDAEGSHREPLLIAKRNFAEPFVMCRLDLANQLVNSVDMLVFYTGTELAALFALDTLEVCNASGFLMALDHVEAVRKCMAVHDP